MLVRSAEARSEFQGGLKFERTVGAEPFFRAGIVLH